MRKTVAVLIGLLMVMAIASSRADAFHGRRAAYCYGAYCAPGPYCYWPCPLARLGHRILWRGKQVLFCLFCHVPPTDPWVMAGWGAGPIPRGAWCCGGHGYGYAGGQGACYSPGWSYCGAVNCSPTIGCGCDADNGEVYSDEEVGPVYEDALYEPVVDEVTAADGQPGDASPDADRRVRLVSDTHSSRLATPVLRTSTRQRDGSAAYKKGLTLLQQGSANDALGAFESAAAAEPDNAFYHYLRALALYDMMGAETAESALQEATQLEVQHPIANWGTRMERIQGAKRLWLEKARREAGIIK